MLYLNFPQMLRAKNSKWPIGGACKGCGDSAPTNLGTAIGPKTLPGAYAMTSYISSDRGGCHLMGENMQGATKALFNPSFHGVRHPWWVLSGALVIGYTVGSLCRRSKPH